MSAPDVTFPSLAVLFLTHFDDIKGQSVIYYKSTDNEALPAGLIEHTTLPSGSHILKSDLILFSHGIAGGSTSLPGVGLFRSVETGQVGRGRRMGTLGVVLASSTTDVLFTLRPQLDTVYDRLESEGGEAPFASEQTTSILDEIWSRSRSTTPVRSNAKEEVRQIRDLVDGRLRPPNTHPITYLPALPSILGPLIVVVYKYAVAGKRILIYSPPPLLPLGAFSYCIQAMSLSPTASHAEEELAWMGNIGLMDLDAVKKRKGGWIATTSDAIYRSHTTAFDLFIDLSSPTPSVPLPESSSSAQSTSTPAPSTAAPASSPTLLIPSSQRGETTPLSYTFSDLPLYRSLILLEHSPQSVNIGTKLSKSGGVWLLAFELWERVWRLCVGVCEFAVGRGRVGDVHLDEGEEDARLLQGDLDSLNDDLDVEGDGDIDDEVDGMDAARGEDDAVRVGRLILRQFHHHSYHLYNRLKAVRRGTSGPLTESELRELVRRKTWWGDIASSPEAKFWSDLALNWGIAVDE